MVGGKGKLWQEVKEQGLGLLGVTKEEQEAFLQPPAPAQQQQEEEEEEDLLDML